MEDQYTEILYNVIHFTGNDINKSQSDFLKYLQKAFGINYVDQERYLKEARTRQAPSKHIHVNVIEANVKKPTDINGLSDPFCILFLASKDTERFNTSIQFETLNPTWNESFVLDYDEELTVGEKVKRIKEIRTVHGLKVYFKEVSLTVSPTKKRYSSNSGCNQLIGSTLIPLKKKKGDLKVHVSFCVKKDATVGFEQHRYLLHRVILYELDAWKSRVYNWRGEMSTMAKSLLIHHQEQCNISSLHADLAEWIEYINVHGIRPLNLSIFLPMLERLIQHFEEDLLTNEEKKLFWESVTKLLPSCLMAVRRVQMLSVSDKTVNQPLFIFRLLSKIIGLVKTSYNWLTIYENPDNYNINIKVETAVSEGAEEWFSQLLAKNSISTSGDEERQLDCINNVLETILISLEKTLACYEGTFKQCFHFSYIAKIVEPIVTSICKSMKPLKFNDSSEEGVYDNDPLTVGSTLFKVYTNVRKFVKLGTDIFNGNADLLLHDKFYHWFHPALVQWLYISEYKAKHRIQKAVELDHYDKSSNLGSSAVDVLGICEEVKFLMIKVGSLFLNAVEFQTTRHTEELLNYVDDQLHLLHTHLDEVDFNEILRIIWRNLSRIMYVVADGNLNMKKEPSYYASIEENARKLLEYFTQIPVCTDLEMTDYIKMTGILELNATPVQELIHRFHMEQLAMQRAQEKPKYGLLTVKLRFLENILRIEILNARDLLPICPKGACDPYVKITMLPEEKFTDMTPLKTNFKNGTVYPLFDEQFLVYLTMEQKSAKNGFIKFTVMHNVHLRSDYFLGEAIIPFEDIPAFVKNKGFESLDQIHLTLLRPSVRDFEVYKILKNKEDKVAKDFIAAQTSMYPSA
ncbi:hypothetical protein C0J52_20268 [Blattella germanica]|nr:hypothetical protein C0J52_20268 [Blattella germanica]